MQSVSSTSQHGFELASGQDEPDKSISDSGRVPRPITSASPMLIVAGGQFGPALSPADVPLLQDRSVNGQPAIENTASKLPQKLDLALYCQNDCYDFFAAGLPKLNWQSQVTDDQCGLTFRCQTHSWGDTALALTFSSCDHAGKASSTNNIGVQALSDYPNDWCYAEKQVPVGDLVSCQLRSIASQGWFNGLRVQYDGTRHSEHVLMLGALEEESAFKIELQINALFPDGMAVCPGAFPKEMVIFATTHTLKENCRSECYSPLTQTIYLRAGARKIFLCGRSCDGLIVERFDTGEKQAGVPKTQKMANQPHSRPYCRVAVRLLLTPAIIFEIPPVETEAPASGAAPCPGGSNNGEVVYCGGVGSVRLKTVSPSGDLRLLPSVAIDVVAIDPPLTGGSSEASVSME